MATLIPTLTNLIGFVLILFIFEFVLPFGHIHPHCPPSITIYHECFVGIYHEWLIGIYHKWFVAAYWYLMI